MSEHARQCIEMRVGNALNSAFSERASQLHRPALRGHQIDQICVPRLTSALEPARPAPLTLSHLPTSAVRRPYGPRRDVMWSRCAAQDERGKGLRVTLLVLL